MLNWNFEEIFFLKKRTVDSCFVDDLLVFIACKDGRIYVYDIVARTLNKIFDLFFYEEDIINREK